MKVLHLIDSLKRGGTETLLYDICSTPNLPFKILVATAKGGDLESDFEKSDIKFVHYGRKFKFDISNILFIRRLIKEERVDIVHTHLWIDALYVYIARRGIRIKHVHSFHAFDIHYTVLAKKVISFMIKRTDLNLFVSEYVKKYYLKHYKTKVLSDVLYNGINLSKFYTAQKDIKSELGIEKNIIVFGTVGSFVKGRDQFTICRALSKIVRLTDSFHFIFIGQESDKNPELFENCMNYCRKNNLLTKVHFLGQRNDVPGILKMLDGFLYATNFDTFGIAVAESMVAGIPVIVNDFDVMEEITENGLYATIFKTKDVEDLVEKFMNVYTNLNEYKEKARENSSRIRQKYSIRAHINHLDQLYTNLLL